MSCTRPRGWISDVSNAEVIGFVAWLTANFAISLASTHVIVDRALELPAGASLGNHFLIGWAATRGGALLLLSIIAGSVVFRRRTPWDVVLTWPWLVGPVVGVAYFSALNGQMDAGSKLCDAPAGSSSTPPGASERSSSCSPPPSSSAASSSPPPRSSDSCCGHSGTHADPIPARVGGGIGG